ncbi:GNAT family N-acetyltransferase [Helicovermis profundi]|uniref:N-acetyltransferase domain-containing protein n=1 Tax=Helicovermis profundi TaxID=3065157 RepID=A0AAU9EGM1_9FIRM|nr:hypothetical protein HLPR_22280 [Clostridia bacterium S502]
MIIIKNSTIKDTNEIYELIKKNLIEINSIDYPQKVIEFMLGYYSKENIKKWISHRNYFLSAYDDSNNNVVGCISLEKDEILSLYVLPEYHGQNIGSLLLENLEEKCKLDCITPIMYASLTAVNFYKKHNYSVKEKDSHPDFGDAYLMTKKL